MIDENVVSEKNTLSEKAKEDPSMIASMMTIKQPAPFPGSTKSDIYDSSQASNINVIMPKMAHDH